MRRSEKPAHDPRERREVFSAVTKFALSGLAVLVLVGIGGAYALRSLGTSEAVTDARRVTAVTGRGVIAPALDPGVLRGDPAAIAALDRLVHTRVLGGSVARVKIWDAQGRILYSDEPRLIGRSYPLESDELAALRTGSAAANVSDVSRPENRFERTQGKLLQVYLGLHASDGTPVLFEEYLRYNSIAGDASTVWRLFTPVLIAALVALAALQIPLAWRMARRIGDGQRERERLLVKAVDASNSERRLIAAGLHDGIVQELAGLSFSMAAAADRVEPQSDVHRVLAAGAASTRGAIRQLRTLLLEIYPPRLHDHGLAAALSDLALPLTARGVAVELQLTGADELAQERAELVFRVAQEALRNIASHAAAAHVMLRFGQTADAPLLEIVDDGLGFDADLVGDRRADGHMGLQLLRDLVEAAGGTLSVSSAPGGGTTVRLELAT